MLNALKIHYSTKIWGWSTELMFAFLSSLFPSIPLLLYIEIIYACLGGYI